MTTPTIKDLVKGGNTARYSFLLNNELLVYEVSYEGRLFEFSIPVADLGDATVSQVEKAITLMRYIRKAMEKGDLVEITESYSKAGLPKSDSQVVFSHYRSRVVYYIQNVDHKNYSFPVRFSDNTMDKIHLYEDTSEMQKFIDLAKDANEYHPC